MGEEGKHDFIYASNHAFRLPVLLGGMLAGETKLNAVFGCQILELGVGKFTTHVALKRLYWHAKLSGNKLMKLCKFSKRLRLKF